MLQKVKAEVSTYIRTYIACCYVTTTNKNHSIHLIPRKSTNKIVYVLIMYYRMPDDTYIHRRRNRGGWGATAPPPPIFYYALRSLQLSKTDI